jgi:hypothetical protein
MAGHVAVERDLQLNLVVPGSVAVPVRVSASYDVHDPYAVTLVFHTGGTASDSVSWTFGRQLLTDGVSAAVGHGDVQVWPAQPTPASSVYLSLASPSGKALFEVRVTDLVEFLSLTYAAVPTGTEGDHLDVDAALAALLDRS